MKILEFLKIKRANEQTKRTSTVPPCRSLLRHFFFNFFSSCNKNIKISFSKNKQKYKKQTKQTSTVPLCRSLVRHLFFNFFSSSNKKN